MPVIPHRLLFHNNKVTALETSGIVFGALPEIELSRSFINLPVNSILVLFSDGICERQNTRAEEFDVERIKNAVLQNQLLDSEEILKALFQTADEFGGKKKWKDDATAVVIKRLN